MDIKYAIEHDLFEKLMPQKSPMLFCDGITFDTAGEYNHGCGYFTVGERECVALDANNNLPVLCLIEVMSQAVDGILVYKMYYIDKSETKVGLFLSVRAMKITKKYDTGIIPAGITLKSKVEISNLNDGVVSAVVVTTDANTNDEIASAKLTVFSPNGEQLVNIIGDKALNDFNS